MLQQNTKLYWTFFIDSCLDITVCITDCSTYLFFPKVKFRTDKNNMLCCAKQKLYIFTFKNYIHQKTMIKEVKKLFKINTQYRMEKSQNGLTYFECTVLWYQ